MMIQFGKTRTLTGPWAAVELTSESRTEQVVHNLVKWVKNNPQHRPFQLLFPVKSRNLTGVEMFSPYLWARTPDLRMLQEIRVMGMQGVVSDANGKIIPIESAFVEDLAEKTRKAAEAWCSGIKVGCHVRVLMGSQRMLCGKVDKVVGRKADVVIRLKSNQIRLRIGLLALENLGMKPVPYFYKEK